MKKIVKFLALSLAIALSIPAMKASAAQIQTQPPEPRFQIRVNRVANCVTVYEKDETGAYTLPYRSFACSVGKKIEYTPLGTFRTSDYYDWRLMVDGSYGQYAIRFNRSILFHSVPYFSNRPDDLEIDQFNLLGENASLGCVRMSVADVKWLYTNCPKGTEVIVYDDAENPGPLGKPVQMKTITNLPFSGWDPTDDRQENPWHQYKPTLYLKKDMGDGVLYMFQGTTQEQLKDYIGTINWNGVDLPEDKYEVTMNGRYDLNQSGVYHVWVSVFDDAGIMTQKQFVLAVVPNPKEQVIEQSANETIVQATVQTNN